MAWFEPDEWEPWNKLALVVAVLLGSLLLLTRPLVWKADASRLGIIMFVPLAVCCVRWLLRWRGDGERPQIAASLGVRVKNGAIVAESLWLDGRPYREWLLEHTDSTAQKKQATKEK